MRSCVALTRQSKKLQRRPIRPALWIIGAVACWLHPATLPGAVSTITYVQSNSATPQSPKTSVAVKFTVAQVAGDLNVVAVGWNNSTTTVSSVTDKSGNAYILAVGPTVQSGFGTQSIYYAKNILAAAAGANVVTVTFSSTAPSPDIRILEYSGADPNSPVDVVAASSGSGSTSSSGAVTTTNATDLVFGANYVQTLTAGPGSGFIQRLLTSPDGDIAEDQMMTASGSNSASSPLSYSGTWIMQMVAFRTPSGTSGTAPTVTSVSPNSGSTKGGTPVTITGTNFASGATVAFVGTAATDIAVINSTTITAYTPAGVSGAATVTVMVNGQSASLNDGFTYTGIPTVTSISPNIGSTAGGTPVTITGTNFASGATVMFGGSAATNVAVINGTTITANTPAGASGMVTVTVTVSGQSASLTNGFTYEVIPTVTSVSPNSGPTAGGTPVTITGTNFASGATVTFAGAAAANVAVENGSTIIATAPAGTTGAVTVTVTVNGQSASLADGFTYFGIPTVSRVSPNSGSTGGGTAVSITGANFASGSTVTFAGTTATNVVVVNSTTVTATTPPGSAGAVTVTVTNSQAQSGSLANGFTYAAITTITYVQSNSATPQSPQSSVGVKFTAAQVAGDLNVVAVGWNNSTTKISSVTDSIGNAYTLAVGPTVQNGFGTQSIYYAKNILAAAAGANVITVTFSSTAPSPDIRILEYSGADPNSPVDVVAASSGSGSTSGSGAVTTTNTTDLLFGANYVQTLTAGPGSGFIQRLLTSPDGDIAEDQMTTATGSYGASAPLSYSGTWIMQMVALRTPSGTSGTAPTVTGVSPNSGSTMGGTPVTITGTNFASGATVAFAGTAATNVAVINSTTITAYTPAGVSGAATVTVTIIAQNGSLAGGFTYIGVPAISGISPNTGSVGGGTAVTIAGTNFSSGATVTFGGAAAANVVVVNSTTITATTPSGSAGTVTVTVTNPDGQSGVLSGGFTYTTDEQATPTIVSHFSESNSRSASASGPNQFYFHLADPAISGNAIIAACQFQGNAALTITDNQSDNYTNAEVYYNSANNQSIVIAESFNVTAGAYNLTATWSTNTAQFQCVSTQIANVTASDGFGTGNEGSGMSVTAGSMAPTATDDLVYQVTASLSGTLTQSSFTAGSGLMLLSADTRDGMAVQAGVNSSESAINPVMTLGTSAPWISAAVLLKSGAVGAVPTGMRVAYEVHENIPYTIAGGGTGSGWPNPMTLQIPCVAGATIAAMMDGGGNQSDSPINDISDSNGNTWSQIALYNRSDNLIYAQAYYAKSVLCTSNTEVLTVTSDTNTGDNTIVFYVLLGTSADPLDSYAGGGEDVTNDSSTMTPNYTLTPTSSNDLVLQEQNWVYNTAIGIAGANQLFDSGYYSGISKDGPQPIDQNGGWMHYYSGSTSPVSFTYYLLSSTDPNGPTYGMAVAFKAAGNQ